MRRNNLIDLTFVPTNQSQAARNVAHVLGNQDLQNLHYSLSEAIGSNFTPSSQCLTVKALTKRKNYFQSTNQIFPAIVVGVGRPRFHQPAKEPPKCVHYDPLLSPEEQLAILSGRNESHLGDKPETDSSLYTWYIRNEVHSDMVSPIPANFPQNVLKKIDKNLRKVNSFEQVTDKIFSEATDEYYNCVRKAIADYILLDVNERKRLNIEYVPQEYSRKLIRAPVPWNTLLEENRNLCNLYLFVSNPVVITLHRIWNKSFSDLRFISVEILSRIGATLNADEFENSVKGQAGDARSKLLEKWVPTCAKVFADQSEDWSFLVGRESENYPVDRLEKFFACIDAVMSLKLRDAITLSLNDLASYATCYKLFDHENPNVPMMKLNLEIEENEIVFHPHLDEIEKLLLRCITHILNGAHEIPRVEKVMFPEMRNEHLYLRRLGASEDFVLQCQKLVSVICQENFPEAEAYIKQFQKYNHLINGETVQDVMKLLEKDGRLAEFEKKLSFLQEIHDEIFLKPSLEMLRLFAVDISNLRVQLCLRARQIQNLLLQHLLEKNRKLNRLVSSNFEEMCARIGETPSTTAELVELSDYLRRCTDITMYELKQQMDVSAKILQFLIDRIVLTQDDSSLNSRVLNWPKDIQVVFDMSRTRLNMRLELAESELRKRISEFEDNLSVYAKDLDTIKKRDPPVLILEEMRNNVEILDRLGSNLDAAKKELDLINEEERFLGEEPSAFPTLQAMISYKDPYDKLWHTALNFTEKYEMWFNGPFKDLNADLISEEVENMWRTLYKLSKTFADQPNAKRISDNIKTRVEKFRQVIPVLQTICNPGMRERHWEKVSSVVGQSVVPEENSSLAEMISAGLPNQLQKLEEISIVASKEHGLEKALKKMLNEWDSVRFELVPYRESGVSILAMVDDIQIMLDDHILRVQMMRGSPYIKPLEGQVKSWEEKLVSIQDILDAWFKCQGTWLYLEPIFNSGDIIKQMPVESGKFFQVDKTWRDIMAFVLENPAPLIATSQPNMLERFSENNSLLEEIQKGLNDYLDKKRLFFPRFFFLSNDELLEILSETKDPTRVQPHLKKCFEGINRLEFNDKQEIVAMISPENEIVPFVKKIRPAAAMGMVEKWLVEVEQMMIESLKRVALNSMEAFAMDDRSRWIVQWPGQIVSCISRLFWTADVTKLIVSGRNLQEYLKKCQENIDISVKMVRQDNSPGNRIVLSALITLDVHAKDVVAQLVKENVTKLSDFNWMSQLRYYCEDEKFSVQMMTSKIDYGFEYLGNTPRLVVTPLTDRCYRTLVCALQLNLGGAPEGPAGTGKTETCKDLAKAVAKQCIVFNCSEGLDYKAVGKFLKGLAQAGAWTCFDEFNRIELEVLSVIAQQIRSIQLMKSQRAPTFEFEGTDIKLNPSCAMFITMNPCYSGRRELPDNLKVLFRTVAMMVPDYALIGEISLYAAGFIDARNLASKIVHTYKLCSEQLSSQPHYDYGMRAVKAVLVTCASLRLKNASIKEDILVLKALRDINLPKFLPQDVPLFEGILSDLFPHASCPSESNTDFHETLLSVMKSKNLQPVPSFIEKITQIYKMIQVRHGLMIVGETMGGKTTAYQVLASTLSKMYEEDPAKEFPVSYKIINPKAISLGNLYGCFDNISHEWTDGVLSSTFREFVTSTNVDQKWIIFDGPVDSAWIENMNSVLDDNRRLCLMSGEIIQINDKIRLIFETSNLHNASPATVSRCGMIYMEPQQIGWRTLKDSYIQTFAASEERMLRKMIDDMFEWLVPPCLKFIQNAWCKYLVKFTEMQLVANTIRLYNCLLDEIINSGKEGFPTVPSQQAITWMQALLLFSIVWGICCGISAELKQQFDEYLRNILYGNDEDYIRPNTYRLTRLQMFPEKRSIFDYVFEKKGNGQWITWIDTVDKNKLKIPTRAEFSELIIPTDDTARQVFFLNLHLGHGMPVLAVGPTGTGKSAVTTNYTVSLPKDQYIYCILNFSARTSAAQTQEIIMSKLDRRRKGVYGPPMGKKCIIFIDDLNMPSQTNMGGQPIELLRQWVDQGYWFDKKDSTKIQLVDVFLVAAMGTSESGPNVVTSRFLRHLNTTYISKFDENSLTRIFGSIIDWHFAKGFDQNIVKNAKSLVQSTIGIYNSVLLQFGPNPNKCHYIFSLRDIARVIRGMLLVPSTHLKEPNKLIRLWIHEIFRVFHDKFIDEDERLSFFQLVKDICQREYNVNFDTVLSDLLESSGNIKPSHMQNIFFGDFINPDAEHRIYDEIPNTKTLGNIMKCYLEEYNSSSSTPLNMVLFHSAIEHVSRLCRVLCQDNGHALLIGIGGSGRKTCARLAAFIENMELVEFKMHRLYSFTEWREDLKDVLRKAGTEGRKVVFIFSDNQIKDEAFVEDINMILNSGDVPNLYSSEEKGEILEKMQILAKEMGKKVDYNPTALYDFYVKRVQQSLHVVVTVSPIGNLFRDRLRMFPSLISCCTVDVYCHWQDDALEKVANHHFQELGLEPNLQSKCVSVCCHMHKSAIELSKKFFSQHSRRNYIAPTSYLEIVLTFKDLLKKKQDSLLKLKNRYLIGLQKLEFASSQVSLMQDELTAERPKLIKTTEETEKLMIKIERDTIDVEGKKEVVAADEALANAAAADAQAMKDDCENDLAEAIPALDSAISALNTLKPQDITLIKSMKNPPDGVKLVMEAVCIMKGIKPERKPDLSRMGKIVEDYWNPSQKMLGDMKFLDNLKAYDKDNIPPHIMKVIRQKYISNPEFDPTVICMVSTACEGLCRWVCAIEVYNRVAKIVAPKKEKLSQAADELSRQMEKLNEKRSQLQEVTDKLQILNDEFLKKTKEKKDLEDRIERCCQKLDRAEKLLGGLGGERERWSAAANSLSVRIVNSTGDVLLSSGFIAYLGPFSAEYRQDCLADWLNICKLQGITCSESYSLIETLGDPVVIQDWSIAGLPNDTFSIDNGVISSCVRRWPLLIDPQGQGNKWIKNMEKHNKLTIIKQSDLNYVQVLENAIRFGFPVLLESVGEELDPLLDPLLLRQTYKQGGILYMTLGDNVIEYTPTFRLYITCPLRNPHFLPEVSIKVAVLNFTITPKGLEDQLLGLLVAKEKPELEDRRNQLIIEGAANKRQLQEIEDQILEALSASQGNILDDEISINILTSSKILAEEITEKQKVASSTEEEINEVRIGYLPVVAHSCTLFFCISDLVQLDPMYQYSLSWFVNLYIQAVTNSTKTPDLQHRIAEINNYFTNIIYRNVCRSLFEKDKLIFSTLLCVGILKYRNLIDEQIWRFLLTGNASADNAHANPAPNWLSDKSWLEIVKISTLPKFKGLLESVRDNVDCWKRIYDSLDPQHQLLPVPLTTATGLDKITILRSLRPDKIVPAMEKFVSDNLGSAYVETVNFDLSESFEDSNCCTPFIFVLSPGADPMSALLNFAKNIGFLQERILIMSLGQGQGPKAKKMIEEAVENGSWIVLQNCHLATSWMPELERICEDVIVPNYVNSQFRLWLTTYPTQAFPVSIIQRSIKITVEPPHGLKCNILNSYMTPPLSDPKFHKDCKNPVTLQRLSFALCYFHSLLQERRKFGPLGWNVPYEFNDSDLQISLIHLKMLLNDNLDLQLQAIKYTVGECHYGGRVTDENDRRLLNIILSNFIRNEVIQSNNQHSLMPKGQINVPTAEECNAIVDYIGTFPTNPDPEEFGFHKNAEISKGNQDAEKLMTGLLRTQPWQTNLDHTLSIVIVHKLGEDIVNTLPKCFSLEEVKGKFPVTYEECLNGVLWREVTAYNELINTVKMSIENVMERMRGTSAFIAIEDEVYESIVEGNVPSTWLEKSYPSLKPLRSYIADLVKRVKFFQDWVCNGQPTIFWISAFFFTNSFLTGVLQNYARKHKIPVDLIGFENIIMSENSMLQPPPDGVYIRGLYLEGARWDQDSGQLSESLPKILYDPLPTIWLKPNLISKIHSSSAYSCPVYKTSARRGEVTTTGHSNNYICSIDMASNQPVSHWVMRGVACLCQIDE